MGILGINFGLIWSWVSAEVVEILEKRGVGDEVRYKGIAGMRRVGGG